MAGSVDVTEAEGVCTITWDQREKRNALSPPLLERIHEALASVEDRDDLRCLVLTGAGDKAWSAGYDISEYDPESETEASHGYSREEGLSLFSDVVDRVKYHDYPTLARINGGTFGGAMHLAAACDLRVAVRDAQFGITPAKLGLVYGGDAIHEIMSLIGPADVQEFLFTADFVDAERAYDMGFLNDVVDRAGLDDRVDELAGQIARNAPLSLVGMKRIVRALVDKGELSPTERDWAQELRDEAADSRDHEEGVTAFMEGREPEFEGR